MRISWRNPFLLIAFLVLVSSVEGGKHHPNNNPNNSNNNNNNGNQNTPAPVTGAPTKSPTEAPTKTPTEAPTKAPTEAPTFPPTRVVVVEPLENAEGAEEEDTDEEEEAPGVGTVEDEDNNSDEPKAQSAGKEIKDEFKQEFEQDVETAETEIGQFWNQTGHEGFDSWYNGKPIPAEGTMPFTECQEFMAPAVQTYWDLIYAMIFFTMITILAPYLANCVMSQHSYIIMRIVSLIYYISAILHIISGLLLLSALLPQCPMECGSNFCSIGEYHPGTLPGLIVFFAGVVWLSMAITTQCRAARAEREYIYEQHLKMGGTSTTDVLLGNEEQHVNRMNAAAMRAKPRTRPGGIKSKTGEDAELI